MDPRQQLLGEFAFQRAGERQPAGVFLPGEPDAVIAPSAIYFCNQFAIDWAIKHPVAIHNDQLSEIEWVMGLIGFDHHRSHLLLPPKSLVVRIYKGFKGVPSSILAWNFPKSHYFKKALTRFILAIII